MLINSRRSVKAFKNGIEEVYRFINTINLSQRSLGIYSYILGTVSGILITILVFKYLQYEELLQQTTRPIFDISHEPTIVSSIDLYDEVKVLCWVLTHPPNHNTKAYAVRDTWGKRCNKIVFISTMDDDNLDVLLVNVTEDRNNLWGKTKQGLQQVYENYGNDYDWFLKADDDTWIFMENLRFFLYSYSPEMPIYFGCKLKPYVDQGYMSGSGYVLSREAVRRFNEDALPDDYKCWNGTEGNEDVEIGKCLANVGVLAGDSRDDLNRSRFLPFPPEGLLRDLYGETWLDNATFYEIKKGIECCSSNVISFHYITHNQMYVFDFFLYHAKLSTNHDKLPRKVSFEEVEMNLNAASASNSVANESTVSTTESVII
ncbi:CLUMA_CG018901, isoform A [Clunio marinus]|uniref:Glycoprotein-N-acetylgalactosamine 3-beta-galactosyltransferase 1 n=1 Tax=Clunio marinus TaxID=568069 RepID=A0A1J1J406_9DIPT|nr:CLUMA_CG018901, isoform A [Clunio marinus]